MPKFEERKTIIWDLPFLAVDHLILPQQTILRFEKGKTIDFGEFCYLKRMSAKREKGSGRLVDESSFCATRAEHVMALIKKANLAFATSGARPHALFSRYDRWSQFMNWCDANGHDELLLSPANARAALRARIDDLRRLVDQHLLYVNTAFLEQQYAIAVLEDFFEVDNIAQGINLIASVKRLATSTIVPGENEQEKVLACCVSIFNGLCDFVLEKNIDGKPIPFPYAISVPLFFERKENILWAFPQRQWFGHSGSSWNAAYDYDNGRLFSLTELVERHPQARSVDLRRKLRKAAKHIDEANLDPCHWSRLERAILCAKAFFVLFLAATGINETPAIETPWSEELERQIMNPATTTQGFRSIKYRAKGCLVHFEIGLRYFPYLRRYLELRRYLLQEQTCDYLFFDFRVGRKNGPQIVRARRMALSFYRRLKHLVPSLPNLKSRKWRAAKQDFVIRRNDPLTAASVMQHSLSTAIKAYSNGTQSNHQDEMGKFFGRIEDAVILRKHGSIGVIERGIGACAKENSPEPISLTPLIQPDCNVAEGCLFCSNYRIHVDQHDIRKILSARQCVRVTARYADSNGASENFFTSLLNRIEDILNMMREFEENMVREIEREVDVDGVLDPFWGAKLEMLIELGMELL